MTDTAQPDTGTTPTEPAAPAEPEPATGEAQEPDWKAEAEKFKALSRKHEERAKANAAAQKELEELRAKSMSDTEKAIAEAAAKARADALAELGGDLVDMAVKAAGAGRGLDVEALLDGLDRSRFLTDEGRPDEVAIVGWVERIAPKPTGVPDLGQGARGNGSQSTADPLLDAVRRLTGP